MVTGNWKWGVVVTEGGNTDGGGVRQVNLRLPEGLLERVDGAVGGGSRNAWLVACVERGLDPRVGVLSRSELFVKATRGR